MSETFDEKLAKPENLADSTNQDGFSELLMQFLQEYKGYLIGVLKNESNTTSTKNSHVASYLATEFAVAERSGRYWSDFADLLDSLEKPANG